MSFRDLAPYLVIAGLLLYIGCFDPVRSDVVTFPEISGSKVSVSPQPVKVLTPDISLYTASVDSVKTELYTSAVTQREYVEVFEDSLQTITVSSKVTGTLEELKIEYKTNPITEKKRTPLRAYMGVYSQIPTAVNTSSAVGVKLDLVKGNKLITVGYNTEKTILVGVSFKLF